MIAFNSLVLEMGGLRPEAEEYIRSSLTSASALLGALNGRGALTDHVASLRRDQSHRRREVPAVAMTLSRALFTSSLPRLRVACPGIINQLLEYSKIEATESVGLEMAPFTFGKIAAELVCGLTADCLSPLTPLAPVPATVFERLRKVVVLIA